LSLTPQCLLENAVELFRAGKIEEYYSEDLEGLSDPLFIFVPLRNSKGVTLR
jgi:hypothetical protein